MTDRKNETTVQVPFGLLIELVQNVRHWDQSEYKKCDELKSRALALIAPTEAEPDRATHIYLPLADGALLRLPSIFLHNGAD